jgi:hypothetical protein
MPNKDNTPAGAGPHLRLRRGLIAAAAATIGALAALVFFAIENRGRAGLVSDRLDVVEGRIDRLDWLQPRDAADARRPPDEDDALRRIHTDALDRQNDTTLDALIKHLPERNGRFLFEGDLLYTRDDVKRALRLRRESWLVDTGRSHRFTADLFATPFEVQIAVREQLTGKPDLWPRHARQLSFAVHRKSFGPRADSIEAYSLAAAKAWEDVCPQSECGLSFASSSAGHETPGPVTFIVKYDAGNYAATGFFPSWAAKDRFIYIGDLALAPTVDLVGLLKHEFGHALGYEHEHSRAPNLGGRANACKPEGGRWRALTEYDKNSVMHYFCGEKESSSFAITLLDIAGHKKLYGATDD